MQKKEKKIHTGFRLSKNNIELLEDFEKSLGINKTGVLEMLLTVVGKNKEIMMKLIQSSFVGK
ncbi:MAG: hypothetical protein U9R42_08360 [Bacteroidota bacterium]|nr:hypothetical protein [Bacteroidota bacterium]